MPLLPLIKGTLTNFDIVDESNRSLSMVTREEHRGLAVAALVATGSAMLDREVSPGLVTLCQELVTSRPDAGLDKLDEVLQHPEVDAMARASNVKTRDEHSFIRLAATFAKKFIVTVAIKGMPGEIRAATFSLEDLVGDPPPSGIGDQWRSGLAWSSKAVWFDIHEVYPRSPYHLTIDAPPGLWIARRALLARTGDRSSPRTGPYNRARFYLKPNVGTPAMALVYLRPLTSTLIRASALVGWIALAILWGFLVTLHLGGFTDLDTSAPALLLFLPSALSALLLGGAEHRMAKDMLTLVRYVTLIPAALTFAGGAAFAALPHQSQALPWVFAVLSLLALFPVFAVTVAWAKCILPLDPDRGRNRSAFVISR